MRRLMCVLALSALGAPAGVFAQAQRPPGPPRTEGSAPQGLTLGSLDVSVTWRNRVELWTWFDTPVGNNDYAFDNSLLRVGVGQTRKPFDWRVEVAQPTYFSVPDNAVAPRRRRALGIGRQLLRCQRAHSNQGTLFLKQAFLQFKQLGKSTLKVGRFEFFDGTEAKIPDPTVRGWCSRASRIDCSRTKRFPWRSAAWTARCSHGAPARTPSAGSAARPTAGGVHLDGWKELDIEVYYGAYNRAVKDAPAAPDRSGRSPSATSIIVTTSLKPDNRPAAIRAAERRDKNPSLDDLRRRLRPRLRRRQVRQVRHARLGRDADRIVGEVVAACERRVRRMRAGSRASRRLKPWLRAGYRYSSGDDNPAGRPKRHLLSGPGCHAAVFARFPFYNMMNLKDAYGLFAIAAEPEGHDSQRGAQPPARQRRGPLVRRRRARAVGRVRLRGASELRPRLAGHLLGPERRHAGRFLTWASICTMDMQPATT